MHKIKFSQKALAFSFVVLCSTSVKSATLYDAQHFSTNAGYVRQYSIATTNQPLTLQWDSNDPYVDPVGETEVIQRALGYTDPNNLPYSSLNQGGSAASSGIVPGRTDVKIWKSFTPTAIADPTVSFFAEFSIIPSLEGAPYNLDDTFSFDLRNAANSASLLTLEFAPGINVQPNSYTLQTITDGSTNAPIIDLGYQALFQTTVDLSDAGWTLSLDQINPSTRAVIVSYTNLASGALSTGFNAEDLGTLSLDWDLASGISSEPGSNYILVNQFEVTAINNVIPEPGTWATALLALGAAYVVRRRKARRNITQS